MLVCLNRVVSLIGAIEFEHELQAKKAVNANIKDDKRIEILRGLFNSAQNISGAVNPR